MTAHGTRLTKQQKRRRRRIIRTCTTIVVVILAVVILMAGLRLRTLNAFSGEYRRTLDLTDRITGNIAVWLKDVEGADIDVEWVRSRAETMDTFTELSFNRKGLKKGTFTEELDNPSYSECEAKAYRLCAECLRELIVKRLVMTGYAESISDEEADKIISDALGMTLDNYIKNAGIKIMPDYNELTDEVIRSGEYRIKRNSVEWERAGETVIDEFRRADRSLIIVEPEYIYYRIP